MKLRRIHREFIGNSSAPLTMVEMTEERSTHTEEQEKKPRPWRPTNRQALWAIGLVVALVTITLLVAGLYPDIWQALSRKRVAMLIGIGVALVVVIVLLALGGASLGWTGFANKTLWEWLQLLGALAIPLVLAIAGFWFTTQQEARQTRSEALRAKSEAKIEEQRAQDEALRAYIDEIGQLLLDKERPLRQSKAGDEVRTLARARTLTVLSRLDGDRRGSVIEFLYESGLMNKDAGTVVLKGADLSNANLRGADLREAALRGADLSDANLSDANLIEADLGGANLHDANLSDANLSDANLFLADLIDADLIEADLSGANLIDAGLTDADLIDTYLSGAGLSFADLNLPEGVTKKKLEQQLERQAKLLRGATMPSGMVLSSRFKHALSFEQALSSIVSDSTITHDTSDSLFIETPYWEQILLTNPRHVFDPSSLSEPQAFPAPENAEEWVSWFRKHPNLRTSKLAPVRDVGGVSGKRIDVTVTSTPENYSKDHCGSLPCIPLYPLSNENPIIAYEGLKDRFYIVDVGDETVLIDVAAPAYRFDEFLPKAQKVLDSVEGIGQ
jgi:hypothetical protein